jgi:hypothetical protein
MQMCGCEWWNPNFHYSMELVLRSLKSGSPPSSFADPQGLGGIIFLLCSQRTERWSGESSRQLSGDTIYQPRLWTGSSMSFWHSLPNRTVLQYAQAFNDLCQYAGYHVDTDEKKRDRFRRGLSTKLRDRLNTVRANSYNELVNMAISQEDCISARQAEKKRKTPVAGPSAQPQRFRIVSDTLNMGPQQQQGRWVIRSQQQQQQAPNRTQFPAQRNNQQQQQYRQANDNRCFTCGNTGHYAKNCPRNQQRQAEC